MNKNEIFTLWIPNDNKKELPILAHLSLKSMVLCGHDVILYTYCHLENVPKGVEIRDGNEILDSSRIFVQEKGHKTYAGFSDLFRFHRLYKYGGTWVDLDVILINNINEKHDEDILIFSEPTFKFYLHPNCGILRFPNGDSFIKNMLDYSEKMGEDFEFGQIGPKLIANMLKKFPEYNKYLKHFNNNQLFGWKYLNEYSKSPEKLFNKINMDEVIGFHINNTFFEELLTNINPNGLFELLKSSILNSFNHDEYHSYLKKYNILCEHQDDIVKEWDLKYLDMADDTLNKSFKFTILIDSKNLRKVEIYNILHSIGFESQTADLLKTIQVIIFGKTNMGNDKIRFKDNITILTSNFNTIYPYIDDYIYGEYVIPLNKPIVFGPRFFKDKNLECDIENYYLDENSSINILSKKYYTELLYKYGCEAIFNLIPDMLIDFNFEMVDESLVFQYGCKSENINTLIKLIDDLNDYDVEDITSKFLKTKAKLKSMEFKNLIDEVSYHYFTSYWNIIESSSYYEFKLKERNTQLDCLNAFYLNKLNIKYEF